MSQRVQSIGRVGAILLVLVLVPNLWSQQSPAAPMTLAQLRQLAQIHAPDNVVAQAVQSRNLAFTLTPAILDQLQKAGLGPESVSTLRSLLPVGTLAIMAPPGTQLTLDGADLGATDAQGSLVLPRLPAGPHHLIATKAGYRDGAFDLVLAPNVHKEFTVALDWTGGYLTVAANLGNADIVISGVGEYTGSATDVPCLPGSYDVTVSAPGMKPQTQTAVITAGQHTAVSVTLVRDLEALHARVNSAMRRLNSGDTAGAIRAANAILATDPQAAGAEGVLAHAYLARLDTRQFEIHGLAAIQDGGVLALQLAHEHIGLDGDSAHLALLRLSATTLQFDPEGSQCKYPVLTVPLADIKKLRVSNDPRAGFFIAHQITPNTYLLRLDVRNPQKRSDSITLSFVVPDTSIRNYGGNNVLDSPPNSQRKLAAIANLIRQVAARK